MEDDSAAFIGRMARSPFAWLALVGILAVVTLAGPRSEIRFRVVEPGLIPNADFSQGGRHWAGSRAGTRFQRGTPSEVELRARGTARPTMMSRRILPRGNYDHVRIAMDIKATAIDGVGAAWHGAHAIVMSFDKRNRRIRHWPRQVARVTGSSGWTRHRAAIPLSEDIRLMWLAVYIAAESGRVQVRNLAIDGVAETNLFKVLRYLIACGWVAAGIGIVWSLCRHSRPTVGRIGTILFGTALVVGGLLPAPYLSRSADILDGWTSAVVHGTTSLFAPAPSDDAPAETAGAPDTEPDASPRTEPRDRRTADAPADSARARSAPEKATRRGRSDAAAPERILPTWVRNDRTPHVLGFACFALLAVWSFGRRSAVRVVGAAFLLATVIEVLQSFTITREPQVSDLHHDFAGIVLGAVVAYAMAARLARRESTPAAARGIRPGPD